MNQHTLNLLEEYCALVDGMRNGQHTTDEIRYLDGQRGGLHNDLLRLLDMDRSIDMYSFARDAPHTAKGRY
jgi:hypothetical protein